MQSGERNYQMTLLKSTGFLLIAMAITLTTSPVSAQTAKEVIDRYVKVIGGREALDNIQTIREERVSSHLEEGRIIERTVYRKRPHLYRSDTKSGSSTIVNGDHAWRSEYDSMGVFRWSEVDPPRGTDFEARLGWFINYEEKGYEVVFVGLEVQNNVSMHHLRMTWPDGGARELFFDVATGLFAMFKPVEWAVVRVHDYRRVGGVLFPHFTEASGTSPTGKKIHHLNTVVSLEVNMPLSDLLFNPTISPESH